MSASKKDNPEPARGRRRGLYGQRPSKSHDKFRSAEFAEIAAMSARERMIAALELDDEITSFLRTKRQKGGERSLPK